MNRVTQPDPDLRLFVRPVNTVLAQSETGAFTVPAEWTEAKATLDGVQAAIGQAAGSFPALPEEASHQAAVEIATAYRPGADVTKMGHDLRKREEESETGHATLQVLRIVESQAADRLRSLFDRDDEVLVTEHLQPALDALLDDARKHVPRLKGAQSADELLKLHDTAAAEAWEALALDLSRYHAIRTAYGVLFQIWAADLGFNSLDHQGMSQYRRWVELPKHEGQAVVPVQPALAMAWLASEGEGAPQPWLPLSSEIGPALKAAYEQRRTGATEAAVERKERAGKRRQDETREMDERQAQPAEPWR